jgi:hypothetical protein
MGIQAQKSWLKDCKCFRPWFGTKSKALSRPAENQEGSVIRHSWVAFTVNRGTADPKS